MPYRIIKTVDGRRGSFLVIAGLMFLPISVSYLFVEYGTRAALLAWLPEWVRLWHFGLVFTIASVAGVTIGLLSKRLSPRFVGYGFAAVMVPPTVAAGLALLASLFGATPLGWVTVAFYGGMSALIYLASSWPNPLPTPTAPTTVPGGDR
jgi:hypothetical protein